MRIKLVRNPEKVLLESNRFVWDEGDIEIVQKKEDSNRFVWDEGDIEFVDSEDLDENGDSSS